MKKIFNTIKSLFIHQHDWKVPRKWIWHGTLKENQNKPIEVVYKCPCGAKKPGMLFIESETNN